MDARLSRVDLRWNVQKTSASRERQHAVIGTGALSVPIIYGGDARLLNAAVPRANVCKVY